ncbi:MAG: DUF393 domain-containing protein [Bacteroidetes bacterium]|nr:DUF393 domain-containing protein [Bacteroidota bacterium]
MKTLNHHLLLYDQDCPLCNWYTTLFVKYKFISQSVRVPYQEFDFSAYPHIEPIQASNKIALCNQQNTEVLYGIDALGFILNNRFPWISTLMKWKPIYILMSWLYAFISYNRKIIIPVSCARTNACNPSRSWLWRTFFMIFSAILVNILVTSYFLNHLPLYVIGNPLYGDLIYFSGQLLFQYLACRLLGEKNLYDYLGHLSIVSLFGALLLFFFGLGLDFCSVWASNLHAATLHLWIGFCWMFMEHRRRLLLSDIDSRLSYSWVLYRLLIYPFAFISF